MIDIKEQQNLFLRIAQSLPKKMEVYVIGGTAMMFLGLKEYTIDVDIVFSNPDDRAIFKEAAKSIGYHESSAEIVYGKKDNTPEMITLGDVRLDLFLFKIISSNFSVGMQKRATQIHEFDNKLIVKVANPGDILIMKSVTARDKDLNDIAAIINTDNVNWNIIIDEAKEQVRLGNEIAIMNLGEKLEKLTNRKAIRVSKEVTDRIWEIFKKQVKNKTKKLKDK